MADFSENVLKELKRTNKNLGVLKDIPKDTPKSIELLKTTKESDKKLGILERQGKEGDTPRSIILHSLPEVAAQQRYPRVFQKKEGLYKVDDLLGEQMAKAAETAIIQKKQHKELIASIKTGFAPIANIQNLMPLLLLVAKQILIKKAGQGIPVVSPLAVTTQGGQGPVPMTPSATTTTPPPAQGPDPMTPSATTTTPPPAAGLHNLENWLKSIFDVLEKAAEKRSEFHEKLVTSIKTSFEPIFAPILDMKEVIRKSFEGAFAKKREKDRAKGYKNIEKFIANSQVAGEKQHNILQEEREALDKMATSLQDAGLKATDSKEYNNALLKIQLEELKLRKKSATSDSAKKEIKQEEKALNKKRENLLGGILSGITDLRDAASRRFRAAGKGLLTILKGLAIAGLLVVLLIFLESDMWKAMKKVLIEEIIPALVNFYQKILKPMAKGIYKFIDAFGPIAKWILGTTAVLLLFAPGLTLLAFRGAIWAFMGAFTLVTAALKWGARTLAAGAAVRTAAGAAGAAGAGAAGAAGAGAAGGAAAAARAARGPVFNVKVQRWIGRTPAGARFVKPPPGFSSTGARLATVAKKVAPRLLAAGAVAAGGTALAGAAPVIAAAGLALYVGNTLWKGVAAGIEEYADTKDISKTIKMGAAGALSGLTLGLFKKEEFAGAFDKIGDTFSKISDWVFTPGKINKDGTTKAKLFGIELGFPGGRAGVRRGPRVADEFQKKWDNLNRTFLGSADFVYTNVSPKLTEDGKTSARLFGVNLSIPKVHQIFKTKWDKVKDFFAGLIDRIWTSGKEGGGDGATPPRLFGVSLGFPKIKGKFQTMWDGIGNFFTRFVDDIGKALRPEQPINFEPLAEAIKKVATFPQQAADAMLPAAAPLPEIQLSDVTPWPPKSPEPDAAGRWKKEILRLRQDIELGQIQAEHLRPQLRSILEDDQNLHEEDRPLLEELLRSIGGIVKGDRIRFEQIADDAEINVIALQQDIEGNTYREDILQTLLVSEKVSEDDKAFIAELLASVQELVKQASTGESLHVRDKGLHDRLDILTKIFRDGELGPAKVSAGQIPDIESGLAHLPRIKPPVPVDSLKILAFLKEESITPFTVTWRNPDTGQNVEGNTYREDILQTLLVSKKVSEHAGSFTPLSDTSNIGHPQLLAYAQRTAQILESGINRDMFTPVRGPGPTMVSAPITTVNNNSSNMTLTSTALTNQNPLLATVNAAA